MQKLMMQCHIKDNILHVPEYIIPANSHALGVSLTPAG